LATGSINDTVHIMLAETVLPSFRTDMHYCFCLTCGSTN